MGLKKCLKPKVRKKLQSMAWMNELRDGLKLDGLLGLKGSNQWVDV